LSGRVLTARVLGPALAVALLSVGVVIALRLAPAAPAVPAGSAIGEPPAARAADEARARRREDGGEPIAAAPLATGAGPPFADEDEYLRELARLNRTDQRRALELVHQGERWYSASGVRAEARQAMGITLLVDLGEMAEARARARRFLAEHPSSRYRPLVQGVTGIHPRPSAPDDGPPTPGE